MSAESMIIAVSGLPRSGTSMMMQMLSEGGITPVSDRIRESDDDNPKGYFEYEKVKTLKTDSDWMAQCKGKCIKIISYFLQDLPNAYHYKIIFMRRSINEIIRSQKRMLENRGKSTDDLGSVAEIYRKHLDQIDAYLLSKDNIDVLNVDYSDVTCNAAYWSSEIGRFLGDGIDVGRMQQIVDPSLYRNRDEVC